MPANLSRISILFILSNLDYPNIALYKLFVGYLVVKPACVNAALVTFAQISPQFYPNFALILTNSKSDLPKSDQSYSTKSRLRGCGCIPSSFSTVHKQ